MDYIWDVEELLTEFHGIIKINIPDVIIDITIIRGTLTNAITMHISTDYLRIIAK